MRKLVLAGLAMLLFFSGCASVPLPDGPRDSLFVMSCEIDKLFNQGHWRVKQVGLIFRNTETDKEYKVNTTPDKEYLTISLPSGGYRMGKVLLTISKTEESYTEIREEYVSPISFFLEGNVIFFSNYTLNLEDRGDWFFLFTSRRRFSEKAGEIYDELKQDSRWAAWEEAKLIGLDGE